MCNIVSHDTITSYTVDSASSTCSSLEWHSATPWPPHHHMNFQTGTIEGDRMMRMMIVAAMRTCKTTPGPIRHDDQHSCYCSSNCHCCWCCGYCVAWMLSQSLQNPQYDWIVDPILPMCHYCSASTMPIVSHPNLLNLRIKLLREQWGLANAEANAWEMVNLVCSPRSKC